MEGLFFQIFFFNLAIALMFFVVGFLLSESRIKNSLKEINHEQKARVFEDKQIPSVMTSKPIEYQEIVKEVPIEKIVIREIIKEVPVEKTIIKEVIKEVPVEKVIIKEVFRDVIVEKHTPVEVVKEIAVEKIVQKESAIIPPLPEEAISSIGKVDLERNEINEDDLTKVWGIGPKVEKILKEEFRIMNLKQLASLDPSLQERINKSIGFDKIYKQAWVKQAQKILQEQENSKRIIFAVS